MTTLIEARRMAGARGFGTINKWAKENRKWANKFHKGTDRQRKIAQTLDREYETLIRPNL